MKKLLLLALIAVMMVGCGKEVVYISDDINIVVIDSCEYLECYTYGISNFVYTHKGNCKYCQERREKELKKLIKEIKEK